LESRADLQINQPGQTKRSVAVARFIIWAMSETAGMRVQW